MPADLPVLWEEVKTAEHTMKGGKSSGIDKAPAELLKQGDKETAKSLTGLYLGIWQYKDWLKEWTHLLVMSSFNKVLYKRSVITILTLNWESSF